MFPLNGALIQTITNYHGNWELLPSECETISIKLKGVYNQKQNVFIYFFAALYEALSNKKIFVFLKTIFIQNS